MLGQLSRADLAKLGLYEERKKERKPIEQKLDGSLLFAHEGVELP
jgi:hypothetical protein